MLSSSARPNHERIGTVLASGLCGPVRADLFASGAGRAFLSVETICSDPHVHQAIVQREDRLLPNSMAIVVSYNGCLKLNGQPGMWSSKDLTGQSLHLSQSFGAGEGFEGNHQLVQTTTHGLMADHTAYGH